MNVVAHNNKCIQFNSFIIYQKPKAINYNIFMNIISKKILPFIICSRKKLCWMNSVLRMHLLMYANYKFLRSVAVGRRPDSGSHGSLRLACERRGNTHDG